MKKLHVCCNTEQTRYMHMSVNSKVLKKPLSENDIIDWHNALLTPGFQRMCVEDFAHARLLMLSLLHSLNYYQKMGYISLDQECIAEVSADIENLYILLLDYGCLNNMNLFGDFLINQFMYDFIWIECSKELFEQNWFIQLQHYLSEFQFNLRIPIVLMTEITGL